VATLQRRLPEALPFLTADRRLAEAAPAVGLEVRRIAG